MRAKVYEVLGALARKSQSRSLRRRFLASYFSCIEQGTVLDLDAAFKRSRAECYHMLRLGTIALLTPMAVLAVAQILNIDQLGLNARAALMVVGVFSVFGAMLYSMRAGDLFMKKSEFEKRGRDFFVSGQQILRKWAAADPAIARFLAANNTLKSMSMFEFDLVQAYVFRRQVDPVAASS